MLFVGGLASVLEEAVDGVEMKLSGLLVFPIPDRTSANVGAFALMPAGCALAACWSGCK